MTNFFSLHGRTTAQSTYAGIDENALPGQHAMMFELLSSLVPPGARVLDLASGMGAWPQRLSDNGYDVTGCDIQPNLCRVRCEKADLNEAFSNRFGGQQFDAITAIEMLEHIENPRHIFRESNRLLKPGGTLLLSTPNASGFHSRIKFLATGRFSMFDDVQYHGIGHIRPITYWELEKMLIEACFSVQQVRFHDNYDLVPHSVGEIVKLLSSVLKPLLQGVAGGQVIIVSATKARDI